MYVIGFAGPARVGKTYMTEALAAAATSAGWEVRVIPFAKPLKDDAAAEGFTKTQDPDGYRKYCQEVGAEARAKDPNVWLTRWRDLLKETRNNHFNDDTNNKPLLVIADDVRYENELEASSSANGTNVCLSAEDRELEDAGADWRTHESEMLANTMVGNAELAKQTFDYVVLNNGKPEESERWALAMMKLVIGFPGNDDDQCACEGCNASLENRPVDQDNLANELDNLLKDLEDQMDFDEEDDND